MGFLKLIQIVGKMVRIQIRNGITKLDPKSHLIMDPPDTKHRMKEKPFRGKNVPTQQ
jgi:hypothetical protein